MITLFLIFTNFSYNLQANVKKKKEEKVVFQLCTILLKLILAFEIEWCST